MSDAELRRISELTDHTFDGITNPYVPPAKLVISHSLKLHSDYEMDLDPVTFEVVRHGM